MRRRLAVAALALALGAVLAACSSSAAPPKVKAPKVAAPPAPTIVCGSSSLTGPATAPAGAVTVPAGADTGSYDTANTTYYFATGTHTIGTGEYSQIDAGPGDTYIGAPGAIISGQGDNNYAFVGNSTADTGVTIEYLTIEDFTPPGGNAAVDVNAQEDWTIENDTITDNSPGAGTMIGSDTTVSDNCLSDNGEYGFDAYTTNDASSLTGGPSDITLSDNEIVGNDTYNWESKDSGCGCAGGGKFWRVDGATVTGNYVLDNLDVGLWADTDNDGFDYSGNTIQGNFGEGIIEEISYNFSITDNALVDNGWGAGPENTGVTTPAIYINASGGNTAVPGAYSGDAVISGNTFTDNWAGVTVYENPNRYCGSSGNTSTGTCTLVDPGVVTASSCSANAPSAAPGSLYYDDCLWQATNVSVTGNTFDLTTADIPGCTSGTNCGENGLFSFYGDAPYSAYYGPNQVTFDNGNSFSDNTYNGPWTFEAWSQGSSFNPVSWSAWTGTLASCSGDTGSGDCDGPFGQDSGSTYNSSPPVSTTSTTSTSTTSTSTTSSTSTTTTTVPPTTVTTTTAPPATTTTTTAPTRTTQAVVEQYLYAAYLAELAGNKAAANSDVHNAWIAAGEPKGLPIFQLPYRG